MSLFSFEAKSKAAPALAAESMTYYISEPSPALNADLTLPGDKSISHRAVLIAALAEGTSTINGFLEAEDCLATVEAVRALGVQLEGPYDGRLVVHGKGKYALQAPKEIIDCHNSGTSMRLLSGILAAQPFETELTGDKSLLKRPMNRIARPLQQMGAEILTTEGRAPLYIRAVESLQGIRYEMPVASAQVKSCLLFAGIYAEGEMEIVEQGVTRDHTERLFTAFSYPLHKTENSIIVNARNEFQATDIIVPGDLSSAAFFIVAACIIPGSEILIRDLGVNPTRTGIITVLQQMGADIRLSNKRLCGEEWVADLAVRYSPLEGIDIPAALVPSCIDEFPIILIAAAVARGQTSIRGAKELRYKETDRIAAMVEGLQKLGIQIEALEDGALVEGGQLQGGEVDGYGDHRISMAFAIAGAAAAAPVRILHCENVTTSFPAFVKEAQKLNLAIQEYHATI